MKNKNFYFSFFVKTNNKIYGDSRYLGNYDTLSLAEEGKARMEKIFGKCEIIKKKLYYK